MHIKRGKLQFSRLDIWNLCDHLAEINRTALIQFKESKRSGYPQLVIEEYLERKGFTREQILEKSRTGDYDESEVIALWESNIDKMILAFSEHKDFYDIEEPITYNSLCHPDKFDESEGVVRELPDGSRTYRLLTKPKEGYSEGDVHLYNQRTVNYDNEIRRLKDEGLRLFAKYFYTLWD